jgi:hypothetical protein
MSFEAATFSTSRHRPLHHPPGTIAGGRPSRDQAVGHQSPRCLSRRRSVSKRSPICRAARPQFAQLRGQALERSRRGGGRRAERARRRLPRSGAPGRSLPRKGCEPTRCCPSLYATYSSSSVARRRTRLCQKGGPRAGSRAGGSVGSPMPWRNAQGGIEACYKLCQRDSVNWELENAKARRPPSSVDASRPSELHA